MPKAIADGHLLYLIFVCLVAMRTALKIIRKSIRKSFNSCIGCEILNQILSDFERSDHLLLNHYLYTFINIYACARGLGGEAAAVEGVPRIRIRVIRVIRGRNNSRGLVGA